MAEAKVQDTDLWVCISSKGATGIKELMLAECVLAQMKRNHEDASEDDILGVQFMFEMKCWIVYTASMEAKARLLSLGSISPKDKQLAITEFRAGTGFKQTRLTRLSIHGIPLHVTNKEVGEWLDQFLVRDGEVMFAKAKKRAERSTFENLLSGNRFCFASQINTSIPRYTKFTMVEPLQSKEKNPALVEANIVVFHDGQVVNCRFCFQEHEVQECPQRRPRRRLEEVVCHRCHFVGHFMRDCPMKEQARPQLTMTTG